METSDGVAKKPFRATGLLNKSQLKLASYIKANNDVTLHGTKRFTDKSGEYYLKNVQLQNRKQDPNSKKINSLNNPQNLENCLNNINISKIRRRASKIVTLLPENSLTPIPKKEGINRTGMANGYGKKELKNAERTAVFIRRMEYATSMKRHMENGKNMKGNAKKIVLIQEWWKTMFKIIKLQKNIRGFLFRKKLMNNLEHQEKLLQFITEFDNIHNYHLYRNFMDNLKKKRDFEKAKLMEKCEDFNEKLDNLEKLHNSKNLKKFFDKWKDNAKQKRKEDLDNLAKKLNDLFTTRLRKTNLDTLRTIKDAGKNDDDKLNDKIKDFQERMAKNNFMRDLIRAHRLNKFLNNAKNNIDNRLKKEALDKLKKNNDLAKATEKLQKLLDDNLKKKAWDDMKTMDFVDKLDDVLNKHKDKDDNDAKKQFLDNLRDLNNKNKLADAFRKWKGLNDEMKKRDKILQKLKRHKENELKEKNKFTISPGVSNVELLSDKEPPKGNRNSQIFVSSPNDLNILGKPKTDLEEIGLHFSFIPREIDKFEFGDPLERSKKTDINPIIDQIDDLNSNKNKNDLMKMKKEKEGKFKDTLDKLQKKKDDTDLREYFDRWRDGANKIKQNNLDNLANKLNDILTKAKKESDDQLKKDVLDKLKKDNDIAKAVEKLEYLMNEKPKKDAYDTLKKNAGMSEGLRVLDKLFKKKANDLKKDAIKEIKHNADTIKGLDNLDKLMNQKFKKKFLDNLKKNFNDESKKRNNIEKAVPILDKLINDRLKKDTFDHLKKLNDIGKGAEKLDNLINNKLKGDAIEKLMNALKKKKNLDKCKELLDNLLKKMDNNILKKYFDKWRDNAKKLKNKFKNLNDDEKMDLLDKYKHKMMQVLFNIYTRQRHLLVKRYLDRWRRVKEPKKEEDDEPKYKKKPRIEDTKEYTDSDRDSYNPQYYNSKHNMYNKRNNHYKKRNIKNEEFNYDDIEEKQISESSSNASIFGNGVTLTQVKKVISKARNYTSQSFFIDKNIIDSVKNNNYQVNTHNTNQLPMVMRGDFVSLIKQNPKILTQKNPRIQVTNATCDLNQIINNDTTEEELNSDDVNYEMDKLNNNFVIDKNKVLSKVIKNCDKDLYAAQKPFRVKKDKWYSVSIPLKNNEAKWEFLNHIKGERDRNNLNKFELIQKEPEPKKEENDELRYSRRTYKSDRRRPVTRETSYKLREMNYSQFYRSPMKKYRDNDDDKSLMSNKIRKIEKKKNTKSFGNISQHWKNNRSNNIDRNRGKIELDPKYNSNEADGYEEYEDSDE